ncbi:hypothetical protein D9757_001409 [Collybiopsis confluens]|uniref:Selenoprotein O n=1 Tax=Collybiopsis confluens TaxID=2823264 RepID=A0A8H5HZA4_9AGAR|nr:hypothetical protein D9757_001409 [Collybiopsis confluens]
MRLSSRKWQKVRMVANSSAKKFRISLLPIPPSSQLLIHNLVPDHATGGTSVSTFIDKVLVSNPSIQRRARLVSPETHFSHVTPLPLAFPYNIEPPSPDESEKTEDKGAFIERWLSQREPRILKAGFTSAECGLKLRYSEIPSEDERVLIGLSENGLKDCIPHLDVGDAFASLGVPSLVVDSDSEGNGTNHQSDIEAVVVAREELIQVLSGGAVLMSQEYPKSDSSPERAGFAPWSHRYSGFQFGTFAGQLGDGRAVSILVTPHPSIPNETYELQLKGAGRTPYSRSADGLAVLRSSIREYLCSEAMAALGIPTTRSLSLVSLPSITVQRERFETACILTRMAPSFIRLGSFEALSPPKGQSMVFFGGGQQQPHWESLRILGEWVGKKVLRLDLAEGQPWGKQLVFEVARRNAKMVAGWQAYGFMHGVINTDNVSILGLTIDYGPYAFMDVFDSAHICNHTDDGGRYAYKYQPTMIMFALRALLNALAPLIGAEMEIGKAVSKDWAEAATAEQMDEWRKKATETIMPEMEAIFQEICSAENGTLMSKRLGLCQRKPTDESQFVQPLLDMLENHRMDFHRTLRLLSFFDPFQLSKGEFYIDKFIQKLLGNIPPKELVMVNLDSAVKDWERWLGNFKERIEQDWEHAKKIAGDTIELSDVYQLRIKTAKQANPRFVLRQWVLEEIIKLVEGDHEKGKRQLAKVMHMASNPYEEWGAEMSEISVEAEDGNGNGGEELSAEEKEERRFCGIGEGTRYMALPPRVADNSRELADAFGSDNEDEDETTPLQDHQANLAQDIETSAGFSTTDSGSNVPGAYDFERDYDVPPPGSPPGPSSVALPNNFGNSNGLLPTSPIRTTFDRRPRQTFFRRAMGAVLPTHYSQLPMEDSESSSRRRIGSGTDNDGVFANVMAKPAPAAESRILRDPNGNIHLVPEEIQKEAPPSYATAQADAAPPYWETTVHAPALSNGGEGDGTMLIDDLPSGSVWIFSINLCISFFFQFVGFLLTFILHTSHAAKYGSRAGLGLTLIQYGFYSRSASASSWGDDGNSDGIEIITTDRADPPIPSSLLNSTNGVVDPSGEEGIPGVSSRDWLSFLLMTIGWFLLISSTISFWRVKRWESSIRSSTAANDSTSITTRSTETSGQPGSQFLTREEYENDVLMRRNLANVFGITFDDEDRGRDAAVTNGGGGGIFGRASNAGRVHVDENGHAIVIPGQDALEEARLARDLRAAGLL